MKQYNEKTIDETVYWAEQPGEQHTKVIRVVKEQETDSDMLSVCLLEPAKCLQDGGLVAFPTETVYGLGADAMKQQRNESMKPREGHQIIR